MSAELKSFLGSQFYITIKRFFFQLFFFSDVLWYVSSKRWQVFPTEKEDILCIVKFFTFSAGLDRLQLTC
jgi:hypothetical protein